MEKDIQDAIKDLRDKQTEIAASFEVLKSEPTKKDFWDKFSAISTFLSGVLVALIGLYWGLKSNGTKTHAKEFRSALLASLAAHSLPPS